MLGFLRRLRQKKRKDQQETASGKKMFSPKFGQWCQTESFAIEETGRENYLVASCQEGAEGDAATWQVLSVTFDADSPHQIDQQVDVDNLTAAEAISYLYAHENVQNLSGRRKGYWTQGRLGYFHFNAFTQREGALFDEGGQVQQHHVGAPLPENASFLWEKKTGLTAPVAISSPKKQGRSFSAHRSLEPLLPVHSVEARHEIDTVFTPAILSVLQEQKGGFSSRLFVPDENLIEYQYKYLFDLIAKTRESLWAEAEKRRKKTVRKGFERPSKPSKKDPLIQMEHLGEAGIKISDALDISDALLTEIDQYLALSVMKAWRLELGAKCDVRHLQNFLISSLTATYQGGASQREEADFADLEPLMRCVAAEGRSGREVDPAQKAYRQDLARVSFSLYCEAPWSIEKPPLFCHLVGKRMLFAENLNEMMAVLRFQNGFSIAEMEQVLGGSLVDFACDQGDHFLLDIALQEASVTEKSCKEWHDILKKAPFLTPSLVKAGVDFVGSSKAQETDTVLMRAVQQADWNTFKAIAVTQEQMLVMNDVQRSKILNAAVRFGRDPMSTYLLELGAYKIAPSAQQEFLKVCLSSEQDKILSLAIAADISLLAEADQQQKNEILRAPFLPKTHQHIRDWAERQALGGQDALLQEIQQIAIEEDNPLLLPEGKIASDVITCLCAQKKMKCVKAILTEERFAQQSFSAEEALMLLSPYFISLSQQGASASFVSLVEKGMMEEGALLADLSEAVELDELWPLVDQGLLKNVETVGRSGKSFFLSCLLQDKTAYAQKLVAKGVDPDQKQVGTRLSAREIGQTIYGRDIFEEPQTSSSRHTRQIKRSL